MTVPLVYLLQKSRNEFAIAFQRIITQPMYYKTKFLSTISALLFICSCQGQDAGQHNEIAAAVIDYSPVEIIDNIEKFVGNDVKSDDGKLHISGFIQQTFFDKKGNMWFAAYNTGLNLYDGKKNTNYTVNEGLAGNIVREIIESRDGKIWLATNGGISCYDGKSFKNYTMNDGLISNDTWSIVEDHSNGKYAGQFWIATDAGVCRFDGKTFTALTLPSADLTNFPDAYQSPKLVTKIYQGTDGLIWFGSNGNGVFCFDGNTTLHFTEKDGLCNNFIKGISSGKSGGIWVSTQFGGASYYDGKKFTSLTAKSGLSNNYVWSVFEDGKGNEWFATAGGGVSFYDGHSFKNYTTKDGLPSDYVQNITMDADGNLWFSTSLGVCKFNGKTFESFPALMDGC